jgi:hypothetical protein
VIIFKLIRVIFIIIFTVLFAYDYFPNNFLKSVIPEKILIIIMIALYLFSLLLGRKNTDYKDSLKWNIFLVLYVVFLMSIYTLFGGKSALGLSLDNIFIWILLIISIHEIYSEWNKSKNAYNR